MYTFFFTDRITEEDFFVEADTLKEAKETAENYFERPLFIDIVSTEYAEMCGLDTY